MFPTNLFKRFSPTCLKKKLYMRYSIAISNDGRIIQFLWMRSPHAHSPHLALRDQSPTVYAHTWAETPTNAAWWPKSRVHHNQEIFTLGCFLCFRLLQMARPIARRINGTIKNPRYGRRKIKPNRSFHTSPKDLIETPALRRLDTTHSYQIFRSTCSIWFSAIFSGFRNYSYSQAAT